MERIHERKIRMDKSSNGSVLCKRQNLQLHYLHNDALIAPNCTKNMRVASRTNKLDVRHLLKIDIPVNTSKDGQWPREKVKLTTTVDNLRSLVTAARLIDIAIFVKPWLVSAHGRFAGVRKSKCITATDGFFPDDGACEGTILKFLKFFRNSYPLNLRIFLVTCLIIVAHSLSPLGWWFVPEQQDGEENSSE